MVPRVEGSSFFSEIQCIVSSSFVTMENVFVKAADINLGNGF